MLSSSNENLPYHTYMKKISRLGLQHGKSFSDLEELMKHGMISILTYIHTYIHTLTHSSIHTTYTHTYIQT